MDPQSKLCCLTGRGFVDIEPEGEGVSHRLNKVIQGSSAVLVWIEDHSCSSRREVRNSIFNVGCMTAEVDSSRVVAYQRNLYL